MTSAAAAELDGFVGGMKLVGLFQRYIAMTGWFSVGSAGREALLFSRVFLMENYERGDVS